MPYLFIYEWKFKNTSINKILPSFRDTEIAVARKYFIICGKTHDDADLITSSLLPGAVAQFVGMVHHQPTCG
jgi:hypothetical protein